MRENPNFESTPQPPENPEIERCFDKATQQLDRLQSTYCEMKKIGEILRLIDYIRALYKHEQPAYYNANENKTISRPEPNAELYALINNSKDGKTGRVSVTPDETFARIIYEVIPELAEQNRIKKSLEHLTDFIQAQIKNTEGAPVFIPKKPVRATDTTEVATPNANRPRKSFDDMNTDDKMKAGYVIFKKQKE
jgi:hypothetical protein